MFACTYYFDIVSLINALRPFSLLFCMSYILYVARIDPIEQVPLVNFSLGTTLSTFYNDSQQ